MLRSRVGKYRWFILILLLCALAFGVFIRLASWQSVLPNNQSSSSEVLMVVSYVGGLCPEGVCRSDHNLYGSGAFDDHTPLNSNEITQLEQVITSTDFLSYKENPDPACQSFVDGSDLTLAFPQKYPDKSFTLCTLQIPTGDTAISFITNLIERHRKQ